MIDPRTMSNPATTFEPYRRRLLGLAYRMLGSMADAEDAVQETYLRWQGVDRDQVMEPASVSHDHDDADLSRPADLGARTARRVRRSLAAGAGRRHGSARTDSRTELAEDLSIALLLTLDRLSPLERAAFLLHDVFDFSFSEVAAALERSEPACRQLAARARAHVRAARPRGTTAPAARSGAIDAKHAQLMSAFAAATQSGDVDALTQLLASDARVVTDGGGKVRAALEVVEGADRAAQFLVDVAQDRNASAQRGGATPSRCAWRPSTACPASSWTDPRDRCRPRRSRSRATSFERCTWCATRTSCGIWRLRRRRARAGADEHARRVAGRGNVHESVTVIDWLLDSDPSVRWQVMRDLTDAPAAEVAAERARVATVGAGAQLLALQGADGRWGGAAWNRGWDSTMHVLWLLREMGLDPAGSEARRAVGLVRDRVTWQGCGPQECDSNPFFTGELEPCINGQVATSGAYFGQDVRSIVDRLLREQLPDGGWNCEAENGSTRSSFNTTICVLEALLEHERAVGGSPDVTAARLRGQAYLLDRRLFRRRSTGEVIERDRKSGAAWTRFAFPTWWHYDVLRGLEYLRRAGVAPDERVAEAIDLVASKRDDQGRWSLEIQYPGKMPVETDEGEGRPSRWNTLRALRVLRWQRTGS